MMNIDVEHGTIEKVLPDFEVKKTSFRFGFPKNSQKIFKCRNSKCFTTANIYHEISYEMGNCNFR